jgi:catechol 2,3-dioxygenase-like lactoylglutathione lyase family enzyme
MKQPIGALGLVRRDDTIDPMQIRRAIPVVPTEDPEAARAFYEGFLGFRETALDPAGRALSISVEVDDVDAAHRDALARGLEVVRPIGDEPWGIRRFVVRDPSGATINVASHIAGT